MNHSQRIPVFLSSDDNYTPYMTALMVSILDNTKSDIDFYIIDAGISEYNKKKIETLKEKWNFGLEFIKAETYRHLFKMPAAPSGHITKASSDRFLIPYMKPELNKAIILDVDMIALGDIKKLWDIELNGNILAAVPVYCWTDMATAYRHQQETGLSPKHIYLNMGTLLVDCKKWRENNMLDKLSKIPVEFDVKTYAWWDEIILNLALQNNHYKILDPKFNMMIPHQAYYKHKRPEEHKEIIEKYIGLSEDYKIDEIIFSHFAMKHTKPWNTRMYYYHPANTWTEIPNFKDFWYYMKMTPFYEGEITSFLDKQIINSETNFRNLITNLNAKFLSAEKNRKKYKILTLLTLGLYSKWKQKMKKYKN